MKKGLNSTRRVLLDVFHITPISTILVVLYMFFVGMIPAMLTVFYEKLFNNVSNANENENSFNKIILIGLVICLIYFIRYIFQVVYAVAMNAGIYEKICFSTKSTISKKASELDLIDYENSTKMNLKGIATDCVNQSKISQFFMNIVVITTGLIGLISTIIVLSSYSIWFIPISIVSALPYLVSRIVRGKRFYCLREAQIPKLRTLNYIWSLLLDKQAVKEMKVMCSQEYIGDMWTNIRNEINNEVWNHRKKDSVILLLCDLFRIFSYAVSILLALILLKQSVIGIGVFGACISAFLSIQQQLKDLLMGIGEATEQIQFINKYYDFLDLQVLPNGSIDKAGIEHSIRVQDVSFRYPNTGDVLKEVSISINKGEKIAIVGENGSGKTTLAKIILGLYCPDKGNVLYDDVDVSKLSADSKYKILCSVSQDFVKYCLTYRENIAISDIANMDNTDKILKTINKVDNDRVLKRISLDDLLGTEFGGQDLSGGEWQKTAIGRAVFKDSQLIVFDEPTSALDPIVESDILSLLLNIMSNATSILISHRTGVCRFVDKIAVLSKGRLVEYGSHKELLQMKGHYYKLFAEQEQWYK